MIFSKRISRIINSDSCVKEWRTKTAVCLMALGMSDMGIENAITGNLDNRKDCINVCRSEGIPFKSVWDLLK